MTQVQPETKRDFSAGVMRSSAINNFLVPPNSVSHSLNVNYDTIIGSAVVRPGTTRLGAVVALNFAPLGLTEYVTAITTVAVGVFKGASNATIYSYNTSWSATTLTTLSNTAKVRFAQLGNSLFMANGTDAMKSSAGPKTWGTTNCMTARIPSLLHRTSARMLAAGDTGFTSRVWFSSIISSTAAGAVAKTGTLTWNEDTVNGDWIDINPDDGAGVITGFSETATLTLVFKSRGMYRLNTIAKTIEPDLIFPLGAVSQEAIITCLGATYFYTGLDIRVTNGDYPQNISRLGVQEFLDAVSVADQSAVALGTDGLAVYVSIGNVTLKTKQNDQQAYTNVVLKYSPRDQTWSIHSYSMPYRYFTLFTGPVGRYLFGAEDKGSVQTINLGTTDSGTAIFYELITQAQEFGDLAHMKTISDKLVLFSQYAKDSGIQIQADDKDFKDLEALLDDPVAIAKGFTFRGNKFKLRWWGNSSGQSPIFEGYSFVNCDDEGVTR